MDSSKENVHPQLSVVLPDVIDPGQALDDIIGSLLRRNTVRVRFNEKLPVGSSMNHALTKASEDEQYDVFSQLLDYIFKGESGHKYTVRSFHLHFMMIVISDASDIFRSSSKDLRLVTVWIKIPKISMIRPDFFYREFESNGLLYIVGSKTATERYIKIISEKFEIPYAFGSDDIQCYFPD
jgi:hypothetical protein